MVECEMVRSQSIELDDGIVGQRRVQLRSKPTECFVCRGSGFVSQLRAQLGAVAIADLGQ